MGPGRFGLPTSRLSGVRSNQLSYEPLIQRRLVLQTGVPQLVRKSVYTHAISKEQQKKPLLFTASGSGTFIQVRRTAVKASAFWLSARASKLAHLSQVMTTSSTDSGHSTALSTPRQPPFSIFLIICVLRLFTPRRRPKFGSASPFPAEGPFRFPPRRAQRPRRQPLGQQ